MNKDLVSVIGDVARRLPRGQVSTLARFLETLSEASPARRAQVIGLVPTPTFGEAAGRLFETWQQSGSSLHGSAIGLALEASCRTAEAERAEESIEIVWTGPQTPEVPLRLTREALIDVIRAAQRHLTIVSFAAYKIDVVIHELAACAARGVDIRLVLEQDKAGGGALTFAVAEAFKDIRGAVGFYVWPAEKRPLLERGRAALHAKAAVADDQTAFVTSANLTGHGIAENMELGLLIRGGPTPRRLASHFGQLVSDRVLEAVLA